MNICKVPPCAIKHYGCGYCNKHYQKYKLYGDPLAGKSRKSYRLQPRSLCKMWDCFKTAHSKGLCRGHYDKEFKTVEYQTWLNMKKRCYYPKSSGYKYYGGRGIKV